MVKLTREVKSDVRTLNLRSDVIFASPRKTPNEVWKSWSSDVKCKKMKEFSFSALSVHPRVGISRSASESYDRFYLYLMESQ